jgi:GTP-binding protein HflX
LPHKEPITTESQQEQAFLFGLEIYGERHLLSTEDSLQELSQLADTAGLIVCGEDAQKLDHPNPRTMIGSGKVEELKAVLNECQADVIIFDTELSPRHQRELEEIFGENVRVLDRTALILDIFAQHANTREGSLQVELAQLEYRLPRLTRAWTHLARQAGGGAGRTGSIGGVGLRGPGEKQLEVDKRDIRKRIAILNKEIEKVRSHRSLYRSQRKKSKIPVVSLIGYTNVGKSTLLNTLSNSSVLVADKLFATLDPTTRRIDLPGKQSILITDTVGFIQKLPSQLVAAFHATLEEINEADLLLHVVDISHPNALSQWQAVMETLKEIEADGIPILTVLNKSDLLPDQKAMKQALSRFPHAVAISALSGEGISAMLNAMQKALFDSLISVSINLPYQEGRLLSLFHEQGVIRTIEHRQTGVHIQGSLPRRLLSQFSPFKAKKGEIN